MKSMQAEEVELIMDVGGGNDRQVAEKLGVSHPTIIRWRTGQTSVPVVASLAIDCIFGDGCAGSAINFALSALRKRWDEFAVRLERKDLYMIADGTMAVNYVDGVFLLTPYKDIARNQVYVGDIAGCHNSASCLGQAVVNQLLPEGCADLNFDDIEELSKRDENFMSLPIEAILSLVAEAERSQMLQYDICKYVLEALYEKNVQLSDE